MARQNLAQELLRWLWWDLRLLWNPSFQLWWQVYWLVGGFTWLQYSFCLSLIRYHRYLRSGCGSPHCWSAFQHRIHFIPVSVNKSISRWLIISVQGLCSLGRWPLSRLVRTRCWLRCRGCGWRRSAGHGPAAQTLRGNDPDLDLRWSVGSVRSHCGYLSLRQEIRSYEWPKRNHNYYSPTSSFMISL